MSQVTKTQFRKINDTEYQNNLRKKEPGMGFGDEAALNYEESYLNPLPCDGGPGGKRQANIVLEGMSLNYISKHYSRDGINTDNMIKNVTVIRNNLTKELKVVEDTIKNALSPENMKTMVISSRPEISFLNKTDISKINELTTQHLIELRDKELYLERTKEFKGVDKEKRNKTEIECRILRGYYNLGQQHISQEMIDLTAKTIESPAFAKTKAISQELEEVSQNYKSEAKKLCKEIGDELLFAVVDNYKEGMSVAQTQQALKSVLSKITDEVIDPLDLYTPQQKKRFIKNIKKNINKSIDS